MGWPATLLPQISLGEALQGDIAYPCGGTMPTKEEKIDTIYSPCHGEL